MSLTIKLRRSSVASKVPTTSNLTLGEVGINTHDGEMFFKKDDGTESIRRIITIDASDTLNDNQLLRYSTSTGWELITAKDLSSTAIKENFDATSGQTNFTVSNKLFQNVDVYKNGIKLRSNEFSVSNSATDTTITLNTAAKLDDWVYVYALY